MKLVQELFRSYQESSLLQSWLPPHPLDVVIMQKKAGVIWSVFWSMLLGRRLGRLPGEVERLIQLSKG